MAALWTGCRPTVARAMLVNACQLSFNTQAKYQLKKFPIGLSYLIEISLEPCADRI